MDFSGGASSSGAQLTEQQIMQELDKQVTLEVLQNFLSTARDKCFEVCVTKPSSSLGSSEQQCLARCLDRYSEATEVVTRALTS